MKSKKYNYPPFISKQDKLHGLLYNLVSSDALKVMNRQFKKKGSSYSIDSSLVKQKFIFTKNPTLIDYFLRKNHKNYEKSYFQTELLKKYIGNGLLTNSGKSWKRQRRLIQPGFSHKKIESLSELILLEIKDHLKTLPHNTGLDFYPFFNQLTFNIVAKSLFSSNITQSEIDKIAKTLTKSQEYFIKESRNPIQQFILNKLGFVDKLLIEIQEVRTIFERLISQRKKDNTSYNDLLDMMLEIRYEDTQQPMELQQLIDELLILFIAGHETTANALSFTFYILGKHPKYQEKLQKELDELGTEIYSLNTLFKPSLSLNILKESMRLYPPAWVIDRVALQDDTLEDFSWKKNTILVGNVLEMNRLASVWENPNQFFPERFEAADAKSKTFIPFGSGPRYCIGEHFATLEMLLVLRCFFVDSRFQLLKKNIQLKTLVTLRPDKVIGKKIRR